MLLPPSSLIRSRIAPVIQYRFTAVSTSTTQPNTTTTALKKRNESVTIEQHTRSVEIWTTTCIVTNFGRTILSDSQHQPQQVVNDQHLDQWVLINPCNSGLTGCKAFPYFPKGGPVPNQKVESKTHRDWQPLGYVTQWGGMEVGTGMLYPTSVVDGLVHMYGGSKLHTELYWLRQKHRWSTFWSNDRSMNANEPCPVGHAVVTSAGNGPLADQYDRIFHTTPPFYRYNTHQSLSSEMLLSKCYENALHQASRLATAAGTSIVVALPLLGSGARGFPVDIACQIAAESIVTWLLESSNDDDLHSATTKTIQRNGNTSNRNDQDTNKNEMTSSVASSTNTTNQNLPSYTQQGNQPRILFGLLDGTVAEQLAHQITKLT